MSERKNDEFEDTNIGAAGMSQHPDVLRKAEDFKEQGNAAFRNKNYAASIQFYTKSIELVPQSAIFLCNRATAYSKIKKYNEAEADALAAVKLDPTYVKAWHRLGSVRAELGDLDGSIQAYQQGIERGGNDASKLLKEGYEDVTRRSAERSLNKGRDTAAVREAENTATSKNVYSQLNLEALMAGMKIGFAASTRKAEPNIPSKDNSIATMQGRNGDLNLPIDGSFVKNIIEDPDFDRIINGYIGEYVREEMAGSPSAARAALLQSLAKSIDGTNDESYSLSTDMKASEMTNLSNSLADKYKSNGNMEVLEEAIELARESVALQPRRYDTKVRCLYNLSNRLHTRFLVGNRKEDLDEAISFAREAVDITPSGHENVPKVQANLSAKLSDRFVKFKNAQDIEESLRIGREALEHTPLGDPERNERCRWLGNALRANYLVNKDLNDLDEAIMIGKGVVERTSAEGSGLGQYMAELGDCHYDRFKETGQLEDLDQSIKLAQGRLEAMVQGDDGLCHIKTYLAYLLSQRSQVTHNAKDLDDSIKLARDSVSLSTRKPTLRSTSLMQLSNSLSSRYERNGDVRDLGEAIETASKSINLTSQDDPELAGSLNNYGNLLNDRFVRTGRVSDIQQALVASRRAIAISKDSPGLNNLSSKLFRLFESTGKLEHLEEALSTGEEAISLAQEHDPRLSVWLSNLGAVYFRRYERLGEAKDLDTAINMLRAVLGKPFRQPAQRASALNSISIALLQRFERTGSKQDISEAIHLARKAVQSIPADHPDYSMWLNSLATAFIKKHERTGDLQALDDAITLEQEAIAKTPKDSQKLAVMLNNLAKTLLLRFQKLGNRQDIDDSIQASQQSIAATPANNVWINARKINLVTAQLERFRTCEGTADDLDNVIQGFKELLGDVPEDQLDYPKLLSNFGRAMGLRYFRIFHEEDRVEAGNAFVRAFHCIHSLPLVRVRSAIDAIIYLRRGAQWKEASIISKQAVQLLPLVNSRFLDRDDQQFAMAQIAGIAARAGSLALKVGNSTLEALELLELGRGAMLSHLIDARTDISDLQEAFPNLATKFDSLRNTLNNSRLPEHDYTTASFQTDKLIQANVQMEKCLQEIRVCNGFERFLLGHSEKELRELAVEGPLIVVNITEIRQDAIIVTISGITVIELQDMTYEETEHWTGQDLTSYRSVKESGRKNKEYCRFLSWLWKVCVKPIFQRLETYTGNPLHVWWIGVGIASSLPFHAAGIHISGSTENTFSHAVSSYAPTIKALSFTRRRSRAVQAAKANREKRSKPRLLLVSMEQTPGQADLQGVEQEVQEIKTACLGTFEITHQLQPTAEAVLVNLKEADMVHFACHGLSDLYNPSNSHLVLQRGGQADPLAVSDILEVDLLKAEIAYLSACSTAQNKVELLADEVIHLASAFQIAGFGHVIGSMWPSADEICVEIAREFYQSLSHSDVDEVGSMAAKALHDAVQTVRQHIPKLPLLWAQYIHVGA